LILLSTAYFPNLLYLNQFNTDQVQIEAFEHFQKKSYRNRCKILSANGVLDLTVPIVHKDTNNTMISDIKIDYSLPWQKHHFKALESAYSHAPFYEFIIDDFIFIFENKTVFLFDLNQQILSMLLQYFKIEVPIQLTDTYLHRPDGLDLRALTLFKSESMTTEEPTKAYYQVFNQKFGFVPGLSSIDLLFNEGPDAYKFLNR